MIILKKFKPTLADDESLLGPTAGRGSDGKVVVAKGRNRDQIPRVAAKRRQVVPGGQQAGGGCSGMGGEKEADYQTPGKKRYEEKVATWLDRSTSLSPRDSAISGQVQVTVRASVLGRSASLLTRRVVRTK